MLIFGGVEVLICMSKSFNTCQYKIFLCINMYIFTLYQIAINIYIYIIPHVFHGNPSKHNHQWVHVPPQKIEVPDKAVHSRKALTKISWTTGGKTLLWDVVGDNEPVDRQTLVFLSMSNQPQSPTK